MYYNKTIVAKTSNLYKILIECIYLFFFSFFELVTIFHARYLISWNGEILQSSFVISSGYDEICQQSHIFSINFKNAFLKVSYSHFICTNGLLYFSLMHLDEKVPSQEKKRRTKKNKWHSSFIIRRENIKNETTKKQAAIFFGSPSAVKAPLFHKSTSEKTCEAIAKSQLKKKN